MARDTVHIQPCMRRRNGVNDEIQALEQEALMASSNGRDGSPRCKWSLRRRHVEDQRLTLENSSLNARHWRTRHS